MKLINKKNICPFHKVYPTMISPDCSCKDFWVVDKKKPDKKKRRSFFSWLRRK